MDWEGKPIPEDIEIEDQPEGGANAMNVNRSVHLIICILAMYLYFSPSGSCMMNKL